MSKRANRKRRQQRGQRQAPRFEAPAPPPESSRAARRGRPLLIGVVLVLLAAVSYALVGGRGGKVQNAARTSLAKAAPVTNLTLAPLLTAGTGSVISAAAASAARIQFGASSYDFGTVTSGEVVKRTYFFTNAGSAMLEVSNVQASCGCTTAGEWTRQVEPGKTGTIPIQFNSSNFGGQVAKTITVTCNDPTQPSVLLQITGNVWRPIEVTPQFAVVTVSAESPSNATTVRIVNKEEAPLTLTAPEVNNAAFAVELRTNQPGKQFELMIRTVPPLPDEKNRQGRVTLKTSSTNMALINVTAVANVQPVVSTGPAQIILPPAPLANATGSSVSIVNNGTNRLALSEAAVNGKSVDVQLREIEAGRTFVVALNFPAGFEIAPGERVELSVKSNHPQYPTIKVPVIQPPRPTTP